MKLKIFGANLRDQSKGAFVVHAAECADCVVLEDLYTGKLWPYAPEVFRTGGGEVITL